MQHTEMRQSETSNKQTLPHDVQSVLSDPALSPARKYALVTLGEWSVPRLVVYEIITGCLSAWPGALGLLLRRKFYRLLLGRMGRGVTIGRNVTFRGASRITLGDGVCLDDNCVVDARGALAHIAVDSGVFVGRNTIIRCRGESLTVGHGSDIGCHCVIATDSRLEIGRDVLIAAYTYVAAGGAHRYDDKDKPIIRQDIRKLGGSKIEDGVWIGAHSLVLDGVTIGRGAIVGAFSMVNKSIPEMTIAYGAPARVQRSR